MRNIARLIISEEQSRLDATAHPMEAAVCVCNKVGGALAGLAGARGAQSLLLRAVALAAKEVPRVRGVTVGPKGSLVLGSEMEAAGRGRESVAGGLALVTAVLELLATFIGEALTLRLVQQIWPKAALEE